MQARGAASGPTKFNWKQIQHAEFSIRNLSMGCPIFVATHLCRSMGASLGVGGCSGEPHPQSWGNLSGLLALECYWSGQGLTTFPRSFNTWHCVSCDKCEMNTEIYGPLVWRTHSDPATELRANIVNLFTLLLCVNYFTIQSMHGLNEQ